MGFLILTILESNLFDMVLRNNKNFALSMEDVKSQDLVLFKASNIVLTHAFDFKLFFELKSEIRRFFCKMKELFLG